MSIWLRKHKNDWSIGYRFVSLYRWALAIEFAKPALAAGWANVSRRDVPSCDVSGFTSVLPAGPGCCDSRLATSPWDVPGRGESECLTPTCDATDWRAAGTGIRRGWKYSEIVRCDRGCSCATGEVGSGKTLPSFDKRISRRGTTCAAKHCGCALLTTAGWSGKACWCWPGTLPWRRRQTAGLKMPAYKSLKIWQY